MAKRIIAGLLWVILFAGGLPAQRYSFKYYGQESGLGNLDVLSLLQDRTGFLWVGTTNGLYRYDGRHFRMFTTADGLPSSQVYALAETTDGTLWVGTMYGLARRTSERFEKVDLAPGKGTRDMAADSRNRLLVATDVGLMVGQPSSGAPSRMEFRLYATPGAPAPAFGVAVDASGKVWYGCGKSICVFDGVRAVSLTDRGLPADEYTGIVADAHGNIWARSYSRLVQLPAGSRRFMIEGKDLPRAARLGRLYKDRQGDLLVPTVQGLGRRAPDGTWQVIRSANGLPGSAVGVTAEDREGSLWIAIQGSGLVRWLGRRRWESWTEAEGLSHDHVWDIQRDAAGILWAATESGLSRLNQKARRWDAWIHPDRRSNRTLALAAARDGTLWVGESPGGLIAIDPSRRRAVSYGPGAGLASNDVMSVALDPAGRIWAATTDGLFEGRATGHGIHFERTALLPKDSLQFTSAVVCDNRGRVWVATWYGVFVLESGRWRHFTTAQGLRKNGVLYLGEGPDGSMWIAYREPLGVSRLTLEGDHLAVRHFSGVTASDKALFLGSDRGGRLWVGTDRGVESFDGRRWVHYDTADGLVWNDCDAGAFFADPDGSIWIGTSRGISHFYAVGAPLRPDTVPAVLTAAKLGQASAPLTGGVTVPYSQRAFHATFAAMTFVNEEAVHGRYRLLGLDSGWTETDDDDARYAGLAPGRYTFEAQASAKPAQWDSPPASFSFTIRPPWWLSWWFVGASLAGCYGLFRLVWAWRIRSILNRQAALERAVEERTRELTLEQQHVVQQKLRAEREKEVVQKQKVEIERLFQESQESARLKSEFLANISHEIRTPMNGIIGMTDLLFRTELQPDQAECLRLVKLSADSLLSVINDVLDFSKIEAGKLDLDRVVFNPVELLRDTVKGMEVLAQTKKLALRYDIASSTPQRLWGDPARLRQVLINLIGNAIKFTPAGAVEVEMAVETAAEGPGGEIELRIAVRDTGIGIPEDKHKLIFEPFRQADGSTSRRYGGTGLGLAISARLVDLMQGRIWVESQPGEGSVFFFTARLIRPAKSETKPSASPATEAAVVRPLRVLVAEDNPVNQKLATRILQNAGHTVICANDGREAVDKMVTDRFDIVLMDVQMPRMDGFEATLEIRRLEAALRIYTPIVAVTANAMKGDRERCLEIGMDGYVSKPLRAGELLAIMTELAGSEP